MCHFWIVLINLTNLYYLTAIELVVAEGDRFRLAKSILCHFSFSFPAPFLVTPEGGTVGETLKKKIDQSSVVGSPVKPLMHIALGRLLRLYNIWETFTVEGRVFLYRHKNRKYLFISNVFLNSKDFILKLQWNLHFLKDNLYLYGYKIDKIRSRLILHCIKRKKNSSVL